MSSIITTIFDLLKKNKNMIDFEKAVMDYMYQLTCECVGEVFEQLDQLLVKDKKEFGWKSERKDSRTIQCLFGPVTFTRTLMYDGEKKAQHPLDQFLGLRKRQRQSPYVELKVAELASEQTYRETAATLESWTPLRLSHQSVGNIVRKVGNAQAQYDEAMVIELEEAVELPEGKKVPFLMAEADGVLIRGLHKRTHVEVRHCILYEGWEKNGKRVSLQAPYAIMSTASSKEFWKSVQAQTAHRYSLENTKVITNSDGGVGYKAEHFQEAFAQSIHPVINQLDAFHVSKAITYALSSFPDWMKKVRKAVKEKDLDNLKLYLDTVESQLDETKEMKRIQDLRTYLINQWERIFDWREIVTNAPEGARGLGAMESRQRHISFRMKKRGMHWSPQGAEAMVKIKQGLLNGTLKEAYLGQQKSTARQERQHKKMVRMTKKHYQKKYETSGIRKGKIALYGAASSPMGKLVKGFR